jgi:hypothetical protein
MNRRAFWIAVLIAGLGMAVLSSIPILSLANYLAFFWVWTRCILGAWLYRRFGGLASPGRGALVGAASGLVGALAGALLSTIFTAAGLTALYSLQSKPADDLMGGAVGSLVLAGAYSFAKLILNVFLYPLVGAIGGAAGGLFFRPKPKI